MSDNRDMGIEFGDLETDLANEEYPMTKDELLEKYGDRELDHSSGTTTVEAVVGPIDRDEFDGRDDVHQTILNMVGDEAEGRQNYSDRGGSVAGEDRETDEGSGEGERDGEQESL